MFKPVAALLLSGVIAVTSLAPTQSHASDADDIARFVIGALVLYGIADAIDNQNDKKRTQAAAAKKKKESEAAKRARLAKARKTLPSSCLLTHRQRHGETKTVFGNKCLKHNFRHYASLPDRCFRRFDTVRGKRVGWGRKCLKREGYSW